MSDESAPGRKGKLVGGFLTLANFRDLSVVGLVVVVGIRFATADFNIDLKDFSFTDLVSLFLAVSSVALSALFYFKADESSRTFYTHTYKFTKEVSEMLGRIDSGFGEKLANIGRGYTDLSQKFDRFSYEPGLAESRAENSAAKKAEIEEQEARRQNIIEDLMQRASVAGAEKEELLNRLSTLSRELEQSKAELAELREVDESEFNPNFKNYLEPFVVHHFSARTYDAPTEYFRERFFKVLTDPEFDAGAKKYMEETGLSKNGVLTLKGVSLVRSIVGGMIDF